MAVAIWNKPSFSSLFVEAPSGAHILTPKGFEVAGSPACGMPWKHEWWCPICWATRAFHAALRVVHALFRIVYLVVFTPIYAASHPSWVVVKIVKLLFTPIRVPLLLLLVVVHERG